MKNKSVPTEWKRGKKYRDWEYKPEYVDGSESDTIMLKDPMWVISGKSLISIAEEGRIWAGLYNVDDNLTFVDSRLAVTFV